MKVTDEMIERFMTIFTPQKIKPWMREAAREGLEAALADVPDQVELNKTIVRLGCQALGQERRLTAVRKVVAAMHEVAAREGDVRPPEWVAEVDRKMALLLRSWAAEIEAALNGEET